MSVFTIIPVKNLDEAKSRLSTVLPSYKRRELCIIMLEDILNVVKSVKNISQTVVIGSDLEVFNTAKRFNNEFIMESRIGLNQAVSQAIDWCYKKDATSVLILPIDIPLVTAIDLDEMLSLKDKSSIVISPSKSGDGTNALLLTPPNIIPIFYGPQSFQKHLHEAFKNGISCKCYKSDRIALDIDTIEDLNDYILTGTNDKNSFKWLEKMNVQNKLIQKKEAV